MSNFLTERDYHKDRDLRNLNPELEVAYDCMVLLNRMHDDGGGQALRMPAELSLVVPDANRRCSKELIRLSLKDDEQQEVAAASGTIENGFWTPRARQDLGLLNVVNPYYGIQAYMLDRDTVVDVDAFLASMFDREAQLVGV